MGRAVRTGLAAMAAVVGGAVGSALVGGAPAGAQEPATPEPHAVAAAIAADGWYADPGDQGQRERLATLARRLSSGADPIGVALLAAEPAGSSTAYAERVLDALPSQGELAVQTVVAVSPDDVGVVSDTWDDRAIDEALDDAVDELRAEPIGGLDRLADALARQPTMAEEEVGTGDDGPSTANLVMVGLLVVGVMVVATVIGRGRSSEVGDEGGSTWSRRRYRRSSFYRSRGSSRRSSRRSSGGSSRRSSRSGRGRGGRRL